MPRTADSDSTRGCFALFGAHQCSVHEQTQPHTHSNTHTVANRRDAQVKGGVVLCYGKCPNVTLLLPTNLAPGMSVT